jgi:hypothetical protein
MGSSKWKGSKICPSGTFVCGLEGNYDDYQGNGDDTGLT